MKKVFVQVKNGFPIDSNVQCAIDGFEYIGYEPRPFTLEELLTGKFNLLSKNNPFVGSIDGMTTLFKSIEKYPTPIDFPEEIINSNLLNRNIKNMSLNDAISKFRITNKPIFIKPIQTKLFDGVIITKEEELNYLKGFDNPDVFVCDKIDIVSEHRAYIHKKKMVYCCNYSGDFRINPDYNYIDLLVSKYESAPISYTIDIAVLKDGTNTVVEFNDFYAISSYGLAPWLYAEMLLDRYFEIIA
jgi:hypothetical protein